MYACVSLSRCACSEHIMISYCSSSYVLTVAESRSEFYPLLCYIVSWLGFYCDRTTKKVAAHLGAINSNLCQSTYLRWKNSIIQFYCGRRNWDKLDDLRFSQLLGDNDEGYKTCINWIFDFGQLWTELWNSICWRRCTGASLVGDINWTKFGNEFMVMNLYFSMNLNDLI